MNKRNIKFGVFYLLILIPLILSLNVSCQRQAYEQSDFLHWLNQPENGLVKMKTINGFQLSAKYLSPTYLAYKETKSGDRYVYDSLLNHYKQYRTFLLTIGPDDQQQSDVMFYNVVNEGEHKKRVQDLNFDIDSYVSIKTPKGEYYPVLHTMENTYELARHKSIYLVFADDTSTADLMTANKIDLKFSDEMFNTGISHFVFDRSDLEDIPELAITPLN